MHADHLAPGNLRMGRLQLRRDAARRLTLSRLCRIRDLGGPDHVLTEEVTEASRGMQVNVASDELGELTLQIDELKQADAGIGGELDQYVDITLGAEVITQDSAKGGEPKDTGAPAKGAQLICIDVDLQAHQCLLLA
jgi:hypothetical protein